jgi:hypothetical protein
MTIVIDQVTVNLRPLITAIVTVIFHASQTKTPVSSDLYESGQSSLLTIVNMTMLVKGLSIELVTSVGSVGSVTLTNSATSFNLFVPVNPVKISQFSQYGAYHKKNR